jgi:hypothetical protein
LPLLSSRSFYGQEEEEEEEEEEAEEEEDKINVTKYLGGHLYHPHSYDNIGMKFLHHVRLCGCICVHC